MNKIGILFDSEAIFVYVCADVDGSSVGALDSVDTDLDVTTTRQ